MLVQLTHVHQLIRSCAGAGEAGGFKEGEAAHWAAAGLFMAAPVNTSGRVWVLTLLLPPRRRQLISVMERGCSIPAQTPLD
jgi:hypothetical protein